MVCGSCGCVRSTIHQPQSRIFDLFDDLIILKAGSVVFGGSCAAALNAWRKAGLPVPDGANPGKQQPTQTTQPATITIRERTHMTCHGLSIV